MDAAREARGCHGYAGLEAVAADRAVIVGEAQLRVGGGRVQGKPCHWKTRQEGYKRVAIDCGACYSVVVQHNQSPQYLFLSPGYYPALRHLMGDNNISRHT